MKRGVKFFLIGLLMLLDLCFDPLLITITLKIPLEQYK